MNSNLQMWVSWVGWYKWGGGGFLFWAFTKMVKICSWEWMNIKFWIWGLSSLMMSLPSMYSRSWYCVRTCVDGIHQLSEILAGLWYASIVHAPYRFFLLLLFSLAFDNNGAGSKHTRRDTTDDCCTESIPKSYCDSDQSCWTALERLWEFWKFCKPCPGKFLLLFSFSSGKSRVSVKALQEFHIICYLWIVLNFWANRL